MAYLRMALKSTPSPTFLLRVCSSAKIVEVQHLSRQICSFRRPALSTDPYVSLLSALLCTIYRNCDSLSFSYFAIKVNH